MFTCPVSRPSGADTGHVYPGLAGGMLVISALTSITLPNPHSPPSEATAVVPTWLPIVEIQDNDLCIGLITMVIPQ